MSKIQYNIIPGTDLNVSRICLGTWQFNAGADDMTWGKQEANTSRSIVQEALKNGINFFDTAEVYTNSEKTLAKCLQGSGNRKDIVIASKFGQCLKTTDGRTGYTATEIEQALDRSLQNLETTYIDLYQIHWANCVGNMEEAINQLKLEQSRGRIRYYGVSNFGPQNMIDLQNAGGGAVTNQLAYNLLWRSIEFEVLPKLRETNMGVLAYSPLQQGLLSGKYRTAEEVPQGRRRTRLFNSSGATLAAHSETGLEKETFEAIENIRKVCEEAKMDMSSASLSWLLGVPDVYSVIVGSSSPEQIAENARAQLLSPDVQQKLTKATENLKNALGKNPDLWLADEKSRMK